MPLARRGVSDLIDDPGWLPSVLLLWVALVGTPLLLTASRIVEDVPLIVAIGWVWLAYLAASALSGPGPWPQAGSLATAVAVAGAWLLIWLAEGSYPIAGLPLFGDWTDRYWWTFGALFFVGLSAAICIHPPTHSARMTRLMLVSLLAVLTLLVPWWWLPSTNNGQYVLSTTAGLAAVAAADVLSLRLARAGSRSLAISAVTLVILSSTFIAAGAFWRIAIGNFTPFPSQDVASELAQSVTLVAVLFTTVVASAVALRRWRSASKQTPAE